VRAIDRTEPERILPAAARSDELCGHRGDEAGTDPELQHVTTGRRRDVERDVHDVFVQRGTHDRSEIISTRVARDEDLRRRYRRPAA
jgi:hypothetical protein